MQLSQDLSNSYIQAYHTGIIIHKEFMRVLNNEPADYDDYREELLALSQNILSAPPSYTAADPAMERQIVAEILQYRSSDSESFREWIADIHRLVSAGHTIEGATFAVLTRSD